MGVLKTKGNLFPNLNDMDSHWMLACPKQYLLCSVTRVWKFLVRNGVTSISMGFIQIWHNFNALITTLMSVGYFCLFGILKKKFKALTRNVHHQWNNYRKKNFYQQVIKIFTFLDLFLVLVILGSGCGRPCGPSDSNLSADSLLIASRCCNSDRNNSWIQK